MTKYSADQVYALLRPYQLTDEQRAAVENAFTDAPSLVIAGAGSGKTELMAVRVLWLVANQVCRPDQILGLTFTRKAANELNKRIFDGLLRLRDSDLWPTELDYDFSPPTISTYNSYSNRIFRDWALGLGYESDNALLSEAGAFQLVRETLFRYGSQIDDRLLEADQSLNQLVEAVLNMSQSMNENGATAGEIEAVIGELTKKFTSLPKSLKSNDGSRFAYMDGLLGGAPQTPIIARLAAGYQNRKQELGFVDYSDQVALAYRAVVEIEAAKEKELDAFQQVLLDEYQDTSVLQAKFLAQLFAGRSVFAVGDPNQSIYGWRGASAANLRNFHEDFQAQNKKTFNLSTSWRNPTSVLDYANQLIGDLKVLELRPSPNASSGKLEISVCQTLQEEADKIAEWFVQHLSENDTAALLLRKRSNMAIFVNALEAHGLAVDVVGLGGLLDYPEIVDLTAALKVVHRAEAGSELIRLLSGPRWRIGPKDLQSLHRFAQFLVKQNRKDSVESGSPDAEQVSIVDALDVMFEFSNLERFGFSELGLIRLKDAATLLRRLRSQTGMNLTDFIRHVEQELWLDIELMANPGRRYPLAQLNAFGQVVQNYISSSNKPYLGAFLDWLDFAQEHERLEVPAKPPASGVVQVLTVHSAKGLEWDHVAIANLVEGDFPDNPKNSTAGWLSLGVLPFPLRGDSSALPSLRFDQVETQKEAKEAVEDFKALNREHHQSEELRLMYVAATRPKQNLLLSGAYWKNGNKNPRELSHYLLLAAQLTGQTVTQRLEDENPTDHAVLKASWPLDPLGARQRNKLEFAAANLESVMADPDSHDQSTDQDMQTIELLLAELEQQERLSNLIEIPVRIPASMVYELISKPDQVAHRILRPLPTKPFQATRTGTLFHEWIERKFRAAASDREFISGLEGQDLDNLIGNFENSRWAALEPVSVEEEIQHTLGSHTFVCKLDAVFASDNQVEIVDWKTGKPPSSEEELTAKIWQLSVYRWVYSAAKGIPSARISGTLFFVADNSELSPELFEPEEIMQRWAQFQESLEI